MNRKARQRRIALEGLEPRTLLSTLPPAIIDQSNLSGGGSRDNSDESAPSIAVNPMNPDQVVATWTQFDTDLPDDSQVFVRARVSLDGGASWSELPVPGRRLDPSSGDPPEDPYPNVENAGVAFARDGSFYLLTLQHNGLTSGELILRRYDIDETDPINPVSVVSTENAYEWDRSADGQDRATAVLHPVLAVDNTSPTFDDPSGMAGDVTNPHSGNVYVAFIGETPPPDNPPPVWNPLTVELVRSTDQGQTFGAPLTVNVGGNLGDQLNTTPRLAVSQGGGGSQPGQVTVVWDDFGTLADAVVPTSLIRARPVLDGGTTLGDQSVVGGSARVLGNQAGGGAVGTEVTTLGIGPTPTIAVDNTLGLASPHRGRIYVTYAGRDTTDSPDNPADNTDIFLAYSDDGGVSWSSTGRVNDDLADRDGFSGAEQVPTPFGPIPSRGRPQFQPEVAVDPGTGAVVVQFYDTRDDAARVRPATYVTASMDGGNSFSDQIFANAPERVFDVATGTFRDVGPIPDNQSGGNPNADDTFGFGVRQGLTVADGRIYSAWSGNVNGGLDGEAFLNILVARSTIPAGPRVEDGTGGVVPTTTMNGTPEAREFVVEFDRPIDASTFSTDDVQIIYTSPTGVEQNISATNVVPLSSTRFRVEFPGSTAPGTYRYAIGPDIRDTVVTVSEDGTSILRQGNLIDQDGNAVSDTGQGGDVRFTTPNTVSGGTLASGPFVRESLPLIVPGPRVVDVETVFVQRDSDGNVIVDGMGNPVETVAPAEDPVVDGAVVGFRVTFDRDMEATTFTVEDVLRIVGPVGEVDRTEVEVSAIDSRTFRISIPEQRLGGTYQVVLSSNIQAIAGYLVDANQNAGVDVLRGGPVSSNVELSFASSDVPTSLPADTQVESTLLVDKAFEITDVDLQLNISHPNVPDLRAELIAPDGTTILLFDGVGATGSRANFINTILDSDAPQSIDDGTAPFSDRYQPQESLDALDSPLGMPTPAGTYTLRITNGGSQPGTLNNWRLIMQERVTGTGLGEPVADRIRADFRIFTMASTDGLSSSTWTPVGPAAVQDGEGAGRVSAIAVDPSDPSGNTVYIGAASGGVWKTNNFLTTDSEGPTWIPLTDAAQANGLNVGSIAVFGRNNDPNQSIVMVATGEGDTGTPGVGFLRSMDGGSTWTLLDSADNTVPFEQRTTREFIGETAFALVVDPKPTATGDAIFYAGLAGPDGGFWRSTDSGDTWQLMRAGDVTDIVLDPSSGTPSVNNPTGNLQIIYAAFRDEGVFISPNQGQQFNLMAGGVGKPRVRDGNVTDFPSIPVAEPDRTPNGNKGRIVLAKPALTGDPRQDLLYQGWLYAAVATDGNTLDGVYLTKDQGQNWTRLRLPAEPTPGQTVDTQYPAIPSNDVSQADYDTTANAEVQLANYALALTIDPTNPHVVYLGGTRNAGGESSLIRIDSTFVHDPHALFLSSQLPDGGQRRNYAEGSSVQKGGVFRNQFPSPTAFDARIAATINLYRDPGDPLDASATVFLSGTSSFTNSGAGVKWTPFDEAIGFTTDLHQAFSLPDPTTGRGRLIFGVDRGVFTAVDDGSGSLLTSVGLGNVPVVAGSRNGNLQISQIYHGAVQPSQAAADVAGALFYAQTDGNGFPRSGSDILQTGDLDWASPRLVTEAGSLNGTGVATDPTGSGASFQYNWRNGGDAPKFPSGAGPDFRTDFFLVDVTPGNGDPHDVVGRTSGLIQAGTGIFPDGQWPVPNRNAVIAGQPGGANFAVNSINPDQIVISAPNSGRIFRTLDRGLNWLEIGDPGVLGGSYFPALAFGAPEPGAEPGNVGDYIIGGNLAGQVYITLTGGGAAGAQWTQINNGDLAGNSSPVRAVATNPIRGTFEAYALTEEAIYHIADTRPGSGATWTNVTSNLFGITQDLFGNEDLTTQLLADGGLRSLAVDWRYPIPVDFDSPPSNPTDPDQTHPILYVGGVGGVFSSYDDGGSWSRFPSALPNSVNTTPQPPGDGGGLPVAEVSDLDLSLGNINRATGLPVNQAGDPNLLMASTFGRGAFAIRLAPVVFPDSLRLVLDGESLSFNPAQPPETQPGELLFEGFSQQSAAGNSVEIKAFLLDDDGQVESELSLVGGTATTDSSGRFSIRIDPAGLGPDGLKRIGIQAIDQAGVAGNIALFEVVIDSVPPETPSLLDLQATSDTGFADDDNYTGTNAPIFDVGTVEATTTIELLRNNVVVATLPDAPGGVVSITDDDDGSGVPDGTYSYIARLVDRAGNVSGDSPVLSVTIDTLAPEAPSAPALVPADDSGIPDDGLTNVRRPSLTGTLDLAPNETSAENLPLVQIVGPDNSVLGESRVDADGVYTVQLDNPLSDGVFVLQARAIDRAGNTSQGSPTFALRIDTSSPPAVSLGLSPTDDTGALGDNITSIRRPTLIGTTGAGLSVELIDVTGSIPNSSPGAVVTGPVTSQADGSFALQLPFNLPDGSYTLLARATNAAGNTIQSDELVLTILNEVQPGTPTLRLASESDTGIVGDGITTDRRPFLVGEGTPDSTVQIVGPDGSILATGTTDSQGSFRLQLASDLANGSIVLRSRVLNVSGVPGPFSAPLSLTITTIPGDRDNDGQADLILYRPGQLDGESQFLIGGTTDSEVIGSEDFRSSDPTSPLVDAELRPSDIAVSGDFDGDGITDVGIFRPSADRMPGASEWIILGSRSGPRSILFGGSGLDVPAVGDYDGDGRSDIAVFRPVSDLLPGAAEWFILPSSTGDAFRVSFGAAGGLDVPAVGDYDGDGRSDIAAFRPRSDLVEGAAQWFILPSGPNDLSFSQRLGGYPVLFGEAGVDQPVPGDYDGDGFDDIATYRPNTSEWFILRSGLPTEVAGLQVNFGEVGDIPAPADYDGDGVTDLTVFRPSSGQWTIRQTTDGRDVPVTFGADGDIPVLSPLGYRDPRSDSIAGPVLSSSIGDGGGIGQARQRAGDPSSTRAVSLDLGGQAARLSSSSIGSRSRPSQGQDQDQDREDGRSRTRSFLGNDVRSLLTGWLSRRQG